MYPQQVTLVYPGDLQTRTGGYRYDKRIVEGLRSNNNAGGAWNVDLVSLEGDYPFPDEKQQTMAAAQFAAIEYGALVVVDGLAFSVLPDIMEEHSERLNVIALIHHPLALETGLTEQQAKTLKSLETRSLKHAQHVITTSELTAGSLADYDVPYSKVTAVMPGTDTAAQASGSGTDTVNLLCVATLTQRKGHRILFDALAPIRHLPWHLYCVGSTERDEATFQALLAQRTQHALHDRISFAGEAGDDVLEQHYHQADVFVLPSFHEGYGMVLTEAIARGLPVICSDAGAMSQTVPKGAGILVPPGDSAALRDALLEFMSNSQQRLQLQSAAMSARDHLRSWQQATDEFAAVLSQGIENTYDHQ